MYSSSSAQTATHWTGTAPRALLSIPQQLTTRLAWLGPTCDEFGIYVHIIYLVDSYHYKCRLSMRSQITSGEESIAAVVLLKDIDRQQCESNPQLKTTSGAVETMPDTPDGFSAKCMLLGPKTYQNIGGQNEHVNAPVLGFSNALLPSSWPLDRRSELVSRCLYKQMLCRLQEC